MIFMKGFNDTQRCNTDAIVVSNVLLLGNAVGLWDYCELSVG